MTIFAALCYFLAVHFIADFVLQSHWMASNKSKRLDALAMHVGIYGATLAVASLALFGLTQSAMAFAAVNTVLHFVTDFVSSRITSRLWAAGRTHDFFVAVGADQLAHQLTLAATLVWLFD